MKKINLAVVGATGMVGRTFLKVLEERQLPIENFYVMASARSAGSTLKFNGKDCSPQAAAQAKNSHPSQPLMAASSSTTAPSGEWIPRFP